MFECQCLFPKVDSRAGLHFLWIGERFRTTPLIVVTTGSIVSDFGRTRSEKASLFEVLKVCLAQSPER